MIFANAFTSHLKSSVVLAAHVGGDVYYENAPQGQKPPYVIWVDISEISYWHLGGECNLAERSVQVNCYAWSPTDANAMADAVRMLLSGVYSVIGSGLNTVTIRDCRCRNARLPLKVPATDGSARVLYMRGVEFSIGLPQVVPLLV